MVSNDKKLTKEFAQLTHQKLTGKFFATKFEALGYLNEDVFCSQKRTSRVFKFVKNCYIQKQTKKETAFWDHADDSLSDELQPQEELSDGDRNANFQSKK